MFLVYYNEARILDKTTFATVSSTLPNIPGAVNNFLAGRTYPFAGTAMLLPQKAPYTDPVAVLICGGATPGKDGLDNCVSITPEVQGAQWVMSGWLVYLLLFTIFELKQLNLVSPTISHRNAFWCAW
jgi:hypothetical protein